MRGRSAVPWVAAPLLAVAGAVLVTGATAPQDRSPRTNYALHCQGCHLPDGSGKPGAVPDMRGELGRLAAIPGGREFIVQVPGTASAKLDDVQVTALLNWLVPAMGPPVPGGFSPYSVEEVGRLRRQRLKQVEPLRSELGRAIAAQRR